jgi:hypothetical protein
MAHAMEQIRFKPFSKYDFVKSYSATAKDEKVKAEKEEEAAIIADAIVETQNVLLENLATKEDLKILEQKLTIKLAVIMAALLTFLPLITNYLGNIIK